MRPDLGRDHNLLPGRVPVEIGDARMAADLDARDDDAIEICPWAAIEQGPSGATELVAWSGRLESEPA